MEAMTDHQSKELYLKYLTALKVVREILKNPNTDISVVKEIINNVLK